MTEFTKGDGIKRTHIVSNLMRESLVDREVLRGTDLEEQLRLMPDVNFIMVGGQSIMDRGKEALLPLVKVIEKANESHRMIIGVGGGARERHTYSIGLDLGLPVGGLATVAGAISEQNALILQTLLYRAGGIRVPKDHFEEFSLYMKAGIIPVITCFPPYRQWEPPPQHGRLPHNRTDVGIFLLAENYGARSMIYVKDEDGLYTKDPKKNRDATLIPRISVRELIERDQEDLPIERSVLEVMIHARNMKQIQIINGLKPGTLLQALAGQPVGTVIFKGEDGGGA